VREVAAELSREFGFTGEAETEPRVARAKA
jgi:hypothetical protein